MFEDVLGDSSELPRRKPARCAVGVFAPWSQEVDTRRHGERVDVQTTEPVRLLALRGQTLCEKAQTIAAKDSRVGHRQFLAECLGYPRKIEVEPDISYAPNAFRVAPDFGTWRGEVHRERPVCRSLITFQPGFDATAADRFQNNGQPRMRLRRDLRPCRPRLYVNV